MSKIRFKVEIHGTVDTDDYHVPADGRLALQLEEDVKDAVESSISIEINAIKATKISGKHAEVRDND